MTENMKKFFELMSANKELEEKVNAVGEESIENAKKELTALAAASGIVLTEEDFDAPGQTSLSDDELDAVAGGSYCTCCAGGGGSKSKNDKICACVVGGGGEYTNGERRCLCIIGGTGYSEEEYTGHVGF